MTLRESDAPQADFTIGLADREDSSDILRLINLIQPHVPWPQEHLFWQYFDPPRGPARLYVARKGSAIISLYAAVRQSFTVGQRTVESWMVQDVMTLAEFRGRGLLHQLGAVCLEDLKREGCVGYTFPNERSEKSFRRNGWVELCSVPSRSASVVWKPEPKPELNIRPWGIFDPTAAEIWHASGMRFGVQRDDRFLGWRYRKPGIAYHPFKVDDIGLLVLKTYGEPPARKVHILEFLLKEPHANLTPALLNFCFRFAAENAAQTITAWLPEGHPYASHFDSAGLLIEPEQRRFVFATYPPALNGRIEHSGNWHLTQGDSDVY